MQSRVQVPSKHFVVPACSLTPTRLWLLGHFRQPVELIALLRKRHRPIAGAGMHVLIFFLQNEMQYAVLPMMIMCVKQRHSMGDFTRTELARLA
ncbi:MAG: hypothetical protein EBV03_10045 [Proteobacteria bacterium]|nr:hypothetical protein [Pseudomonadota bacterium]